jgi:hypothetical protein
MPTQPDRGPFLGLLGWLNEAGEVPLNLLRGRPVAAGRKAVDFLGDTVDAAIPGDWIPHVSEDDDSVTASDVAGIDRQRHPAWAKFTDTVGGTALNPLSYLGLRGGAIKAGVPLTEGTAIPGTAAAIDKVKGAYRAGRDMLPDGVNKSIDASTHAVRKTFNWLDVPDETMAGIKRAKAAGYQSARVGTDEAARAYAGLTPEERIAAGQYAGGAMKTHGPAAYSPVEHTPEGLDRYIGSLEPSETMRPGVVRQAIADHRALSAAQLGELRSSKAFRRDVQGPDQSDYMQRQYADEFRDEQSLFGGKSSGKPSAMKARDDNLRSNNDYADFLSKNPEASPELDILNADMRRSAQQGRIIEKQAIAKELEPQIKDDLLAKVQSGTPEEAAAAINTLNSLKDGISISKAEHRLLVEDAINKRNKTNVDEGYRLANAWQGVAPRGDDIFSQSLSKANRLFKAGATGGTLGIPRPGFTVRNRVGNTGQLLTSDELRGTFFKNVARIPQDLLGSAANYVNALRGKGAKPLVTDAMGGELQHIEDAFAQAGGDVNKLREYVAKHPNGAQMQGAMDNGVLDNFVSAEGLLENSAKSARGQRLGEISNAPSAMSQGAEHRMRYGAFKDAKAKGYSDEEAARIAREINLDYDVSGVANRRFRDAVPFGAFLSQNAKQQSKFLARHPVAGVAAGQLFNDDEGLPKYPWLDRNISIPTGVDEKGNPTYLTSLGLPVEALTAIPGFNHDDLYRDTIGQIQPLAKSAIAYGVGKDPFTGQAYGQYDKVFDEHRGQAGRIYNNIKGTGLLQPLTAPLDQAQMLTSSKTSAGEKALQYLTGARFVNVDSNLAEQQQLEAYLAEHPEVKRSVQPYLDKGSDNQGLLDVIHELRAAKKKSRDLRKAAAPI